MNKEIMIRKYKIDDEIQRINGLIEVYNKIRECKSMFRKEESINAIKEIEEYCEKEWEKIKKLKIESKKMRFEFRECCEHDILKEVDAVENISYCCLICGRKFLESEIDFDCSILSEEFYDYLVHEIIKRYLTSDKDMYDVILEYLSENKELKNTKVYRRVK